MDKAPERLDSWKAIAEYLGRDRTTVMRWARTTALPVRRVPGGRSVFAYKAELDRWLAEPRPAATSAADPRPDGIVEATAGGHSHRRWRVPTRAALAAGAVLALVMAGMRWVSATAPVAGAVMAGQDIVAVDARGQELWRYRLPPIDGHVVPARLLVADIDNDSQREVLAALSFSKDAGAYGTLIVLDGRGGLRWERTLEDRYRFGADEFAPAWFPEDVLVYYSDGAARIAVAQHHHTWWPSVVVTYDRDGRPIDRFVHAGWIRDLAMTQDGRYLLAAGISNSFGGAALAVLDAAHPGGTVPAGGGSLPPCANCPDGAPLAYFVAPWSDLAQPSDTPNGVVQVHRDGAIEWHANQRGEDSGKAPTVIIGLSPALDLVRSDVNNYFTEIQTALERAGTRSTSTSDWRRPRVREWTLARGWRELVPN